MNAEREVIAKLKTILKEIDVAYSNILLFGSITGKDFEVERDWDFMVVVKGNLDLKEKKVANTTSDEVYTRGTEV
jgi:hypothetical protein